MNVSPIERARRVGRRLGIGLFVSLVGSFTVVCSAQVLLQGFSASRDSSVTDCRTGLGGLIVSLDRARQSAMVTGGGERHRLTRFRASLLPEWKSRDELERLCASDPSNRKAFLELDRLRWAEEHAVRYESAELAPVRQRVLSIEQTLREHAEPSP